MNVNNFFVYLYNFAKQFVEGFSAVVDWMTAPLFSVQSLKSVLDFVTFSPFKAIYNWFAGGGRVPEFLSTLTPVGILFGAGLPALLGIILARWVIDTFT